MSVEVTVLFFDGCPSWRSAIEALQAAAVRAGVQVHVKTRRVETEQDAQRLSFTGSPTILVPGRDPFARPEALPALACRIYPTPDGLSGSPTVDQLVSVLRQVAS